MPSAYDACGPRRYWPFRLARLQFVYHQAALQMCAQSPLNSSLSLSLVLNALPTSRVNESPANREQYQLLIRIRRFTRYFSAPAPVRAL